MNNPGRVRGSQCAGDLPGDLDRLGDAQPAALAQALRQTLPSHAFHHDVAGAPISAGVEHRDDVRVIGPRRGPRLPLETLKQRADLRQGSRQHLDRHDAVKRKVAGAVHDTHATPAQNAQELVPAGERFFGAILRHSLSQRRRYLTRSVAQRASGRSMPPQA